MRSCASLLTALLIGASSATAATFTSPDTTYSNVNYTVGLASAGDTVLVPAGTSTWASASSLSLTKGITLRGAGGWKTYIKQDNGVGGANSWFFTISTATPASDPAFRVTGFAFDGLGDSLAFAVFNSDSYHPLHNIRIDHNIFTNFVWEIASNPNYLTVTFSGAIQGIFDSNLILNNGQTFFIHCDGNQQSQWDFYNPQLGTTNSMYIENNYFDAFYGINGGEFGSAYVTRYNTIKIGWTQVSPLLDMHGNAGAGHGGYYGGNSAEGYGNSVDAPLVGANDVKMAHMRGGVSIMCYNYLKQSVGTYYNSYQEEYSDGENAVTNTKPQHVNNSYSWNSREGATNGQQAVTFWSTDGTSTNTISPNKDFWTNVWGVFDGSVGVGMGLPASRPAVATNGVAYWATTQDVASVPAVSVGTNPIVPLSGTLYVYLTNGSSWLPYWTPLVYPHPMVTAQDSDPAITVQPSNQTVTAPAPATFSVTATGTATLTYQWYKNGVLIGGATSASYTTPATTTGDNGAVFYVIVSGPGPSSPVTSSSAVLGVNGGLITGGGPPYIKTYGRGTHGQGTH